MFHAIEGNGKIEPSGMAERIFQDHKGLHTDEEVVGKQFSNAFFAFDEELKQLHLSDLLIPENTVNGWTYWKEKVK